MEWRQLPEAAVPQFTEGIRLLLLRWPALKMAVENEWGGPHSRATANQLAIDIFNWFTVPRRDPLYIDELEDLLDEVMLSLNTEVDDGSVEETAENLMIMHEECLQGDYTSIEKLREINPRAVVPVQHIEQVEDDGQNMRDEDASKMLVDTPESSSMSNSGQEMKSDHRPQSLEEEEEWTTVKSKKKNHGRRS